MPRYDLAQRGFVGPWISYPSDETLVTKAWLDYHDQVHLDTPTLSPAAAGDNLIRPTVDVTALTLKPKAAGVQDTLRSYLNNGTTLALRVRATGDLSLKVATASEADRGVEWLADDPAGGSWGIRARQVPSFLTPNNLLSIDWNEPSGAYFHMEFDSDFNQDGTDASRQFEWNVDFFPPGPRTEPNRRRAAGLAVPRHASNPDYYKPHWHFLANHTNGFKVTGNTFFYGASQVNPVTDLVALTLWGAGAGAAKVLVVNDKDGNPKWTFDATNRILNLASGVHDIRGDNSVFLTSNYASGDITLRNLANGWQWLFDRDGLFTAPKILGSPGGADFVPLTGRGGGAGTSKLLILQDKTATEILSVTPAGILNLISGSDVRSAAHLFVSTNHVGGTITIRNMPNNKSIVFGTDGSLTFGDAQNLIFGTGTGTKIGTSASQKLGFFGATPVTQRSAITAPSGGTVQDAEARAAVTSILTVLSNLGFTA